MTKRANLLPQALRELDIDVPVMRIDDADDGLTLYLYGGQVKHWNPQLSLPETQPVERAAPAPDVLSLVWGIGTATAGKLHARDITSYRQLADALEHGELTDLMGEATMDKVRAWLEANGYLAPF